MIDKQETAALPEMENQPNKPNPRRPRRTDIRQLGARLTQRLSLRRVCVGIAVFSAVAASAIAVAVPKTEATITLPGKTPVMQDVVTEQQQYQLTDADINKENVQRVIASLARPDAYSAAVTNTLYWNADWQEIEATQYVRDDVCLTEFYNDEKVAEQYSATKDDEYYAWRRGAQTYYNGPAGIISADDSSMIPTYETVVEEETDSIVDAGLRTVNGESCIYVTVTDAETGYNLTYWVSTVSGLLVQADYIRGSQLVRSVVMDEIVQRIPSKSLYLLPDDTSLLPRGAEEGEDVTDEQSTTATQDDGASVFASSNSPVIAQRSGNQAQPSVSQPVG